MVKIICDAIVTRKTLYLYYDGGYRLVEPYCHGVSTALNEVLCCYQVSGYSESNKPEDWKLFNVTKMENIRIDETPFRGNRLGYNPNDSRMIEIHCHI